MLYLSPSFDCLESPDHLSAAAARPGRKPTARILCTVKLTRSVRSEAAQSSRWRESLGRLNILEQPTCTVLGGYEPEGALGGSNFWRVDTILQPTLTNRPADGIGLWD